MPRFLRPTAPTAATALVTSDPKRAMDLASALTEGPLMSNLARGLWGYYGEVPGGAALTIQSTGIGGPSAAAVIADLAEQGVTRAIYLGTCNGVGRTQPGAELVVGDAVAADGVGSVFTAGSPIRANAAITAALAAALRQTPTTIASVDLYGQMAESNAKSGIAAADLSTAAVLGASAHAGIACGAALVVEEANGVKLSDETLDAAMLSVGSAAASALAAAVQA